LDPVAVKGLFRRHFGFTPAGVVRVPGSVGVLGDHTEENGGLTLSVAVSCYLFLAYSGRTDGQIELVSSAFPDAHRFWISRLVHSSAAPWADVVKGTLAQLRRRGVHFNGFNAAIHSSIPTGIGMGSSAALEIATALTVRQLFPFSLTERGAGVPPPRDRRGRLPPLPMVEKMFLARTCQAAELEFMGATSSLTGPISSLFGRAYHLTAIDHRFETVGHAPLIGETLVLCDSGVRPRPGGSDDSDRHEHCQLAARALRARSLRSVDPASLKARRADLNLREFECAYHVVGEIQRVVFAERALREDDHRQFGQYLFQSHDSSRDFLRNSCFELDLLVKLARGHAGCLGARLTGPGLGGATVNVVAYHQAEEFAQAIARQFEAHTGAKIRPSICQIVDGAS
jgi:galactokinase